MTLRLLATGGTIASRLGAGGAVVPAVSPADLVAATPGLEALGPFEVEQLDHVNGWNVTPAVMRQVAERARAALCDDGVDGVVVTHGTDTIEETCYLTELLAGDAGAIVFACAMRNGSEVGADGPRNLLGAARVARSPAARGLGALLCANDEVHAARWVTKTDTLAVQTFRSPEAGPVGHLDGERVRFTLAPPPRPARGAELVTDVALVKVYTGMDDAVLRWHVDRGVRGLVVEGTGAGHVPGPVVPGLAYAAQHGVPVVLTSRCWTGRTAAVYGGPGGGITLDEFGVLRANGLPSPKARIALMVALGISDDPAHLRAWFAGV